jgi:predicted exporter
VTNRATRVLTLVLLGGLAMYSLARLEFTTSIAHFIPSSAEAELVELSLELVESPLARRMVLSLEGDGAEDVARELAASLRSHEEVAWVETGVDDLMFQAIYELYFPRRLYLASDRPELEIPQLLSEEGLLARAGSLRRRLAQPDSILVARAAREDPLGLFDRILERIQRFGRAAGEGELTPDARVAVVQLGLRSSPFDSARQAGLLAFVESEFDRLSSSEEGGLVLEQSGVNRFALASERSIRGDVGFISVVSICVVSGLFLVVFRQPLHLLSALLAPLCGFAFALAVSVSGADPIHGITLGFGFVLIGVSIDYPIHLINQHSLSADRPSARQAVGRIRSSLLLSGLTTTLAFASLAFSEFPGLGEMGRFAALGVPVAVAFTMWSLPEFLPRDPTATRAQRALSGGFTAVVQWLSPRRGLCFGGLFATAIVAAAGLSMLRWEDDPGSLLNMDPALQAESERVLSRLASFDGGRFVVGTAEDAQAALRLNARIHERLEGAVARGELAGIGSLHSFLWPEDLQRRNLAAFRESPGLGERIDRSFASAGFAPGAFRTFDASVAAPPAPLLPEDLAATPLARLLGSLVELEGRFAVLTYLRGVESPGPIEAALEGLPNVHYVDQKRIIAGVYQGYRRSTVRMLALGSAIVLAVLLVRYRFGSLALLASVPPALGATTTLGLFGLFDVPVNIASAVSLLVVLGMGVDYGIFAVDGANRQGDEGATLSSLLVSCVTSVFVFGVLALSTQPVLRAVGLTTGVGVLIALAVSPVTMALARRGVRG